MPEVKSVDEQLKEQGLRLASPNERGWYTLVVVGTVVRKVWATDEKPVKKQAAN